MRWKAGSTTVRTGVPPIQQLRDDRRHHSRPCAAVFVQPIPELADIETTRDYD